MEQDNASCDICVGNNAVAALACLLIPTILFVLCCSVISTNFVSAALALFGGKGVWYEVLLTGGVRRANGRNRVSIIGLVF